MVTLETNFGKITISLSAETTPLTVENFLNYVKSGFYDGVIFHRVIENFMVQGGGFDAKMAPKETGSTIKNEANLGGSNKRGTLAMARTSDPHSASAQFFINVKDNNFLDFQAESAQGWGYCVFGEVTEGMDIVDKIRATKTGSSAGHQDVPLEPVIIEKAYVTEE